MHREAQGHPEDCSRRFSQFEGGCNAYGMGKSTVQGSGGFAKGAASKPDLHKLTSSLSVLSRLSPLSRRQACSMLVILAPPGLSDSSNQPNASPPPETTPSTSTTVAQLSPGEAGPQP